MDTQSFPVTNLNQPNTHQAVSSQQQHREPAVPFYSILNEPLPPTPSHRQQLPGLFLQPSTVSGGQLTNQFIEANSLQLDHNVVGPSDHYGVQQQQHQSYANSNNRNPNLEQRPAAAVAAHQEGTKVCVIVDSKTPIIVKVPCAPSQVTLAHLKLALPSIDAPNYKYFFKSSDSEFGIVKEEIQEDDAKLPTYRNRIVAWIVTPNKTSEYGATNRTDSVAYSTNTFYEADDVDGRTGGSSSMLNTCSDVDSSSYFTETEDDSVSCSNYSETTCDTFISRTRNNRSNRQQQSAQQHNYCNRTNNNSSSRRYNTEPQSQYQTTTTASSNITHNHTNLSPSSSTTSSSATDSDATAVQCVTVHLVLTNENFLGLHIYANTVNGLDEGIYVDGVTENSAVAIDGRIEAGDKLIQVNEANLEELSNEDAVRILKEAVIKRGALKLVVAKFVENNRGQELDGIIGPKDTIHPIDTAAWVAHAQAITIPTNNPLEHTCSATSSPSFGSNAQDADYIRPASTGMLRMRSGLRLNKLTTDMKVIVEHMKLPECGLDIRDREWLKIHIAEAFLGSDIVAWLERNVYGFKNNRDAKKFASKMMKEGYIRDPLSKKSFSSKSYYTFVI